MNKRTQSTPDYLIKPQETGYISQGRASAELQQSPSADRIAKNKIAQARDVAKVNLLRRLKKDGLLGNEEQSKKVLSARGYREDPLQNHLLQVMAKYELSRRRNSSGSELGLKDYLTDCMMKFMRDMDDRMMRQMWEGYLEKWLREEPQDDGGVAELPRGVVPRLHLKEQKPNPSTFLLDQRVGAATMNKPFSAQKLARSIAEDQRLRDAEPIDEREEVGKSYSFGPGGTSRNYLKFDDRGKTPQLEYQTVTSEAPESYGQQSKSVRKTRKSRLEQPKTKAQKMVEDKHYVYYVESARVHQQERMSPSMVYQQMAYSQSSAERRTGHNFTKQQSIPSTYHKDQQDELTNRLYQDHSERNKRRSELKAKYDEEQQKKCTFEPKIDRDNQVASRYLQETATNGSASLVYTTAVAQMIRKARSPTIRRNQTMSMTTQLAQTKGKIQVYGQKKQSVMDIQQQIQTQVSARQTFTPALDQQKQDPQHLSRNEGSPGQTRYWKENILKKALSPSQSQRTMNEGTKKDYKGLFSDVRTQNIAPKQPQSGVPYEQGGQYFDQSTDGPESNFFLSSRRLDHELKKSDHAIGSTQKLRRNKETRSPRIKIGMEESEDDNPNAVFDSQSKDQNEANISTGPINISEIVDTSIKSYRGGEKVRRTRQGRKNKQNNNLYQEHYDAYV